ncbi:MAG TPA: UDP-N-acetylmuramate dehydrogenase [Chloroflexota bacterium]|nr:UDP-N-acetylmuramate dehydrogenase [Chloroflexota bacterium]
MTTFAVADEALERLAEQLGPGVRRRELLAPYTSYRIGGPADLFLVATRPETVVAALRAADTWAVPCLLIGGASNLLVADAGVAGLVVKLALTGVRFVEDPERPEHVTVVAAAGCQLAALARQCAQRGLAGLVWASNVPGSVGAAVVNNAGAFGGCMADVLVRALVVDPQGRVHHYTPAELAMQYRSTRLKAGSLRGAVLEAELALTRGDRAALLAELAAVRARRRQTQPSGFSAGSMFVNPPGDAAGRLIEAAGLKGYRCGNAQISVQHANFFLNLGGATARDVYTLMRIAQDAVYARTGIWLRPEVQLVGRWDPAELAALAGPGVGE